MIPSPPLRKHGQSNQNVISSSAFAEAPLFRVHDGRGKARTPRVLTCPGEPLTSDEEMYLVTPQKMDEEILVGPSARVKRAALFVTLPHVIEQSEQSASFDVRQLRFPSRLRDCRLLHEHDYA